MTLTQIEAMGLTLVLEAAVAAALAFPLARNPLLCAAAAIVASCVTHPILWAIYYDVVSYLGAYTTPLLEFAIMAAETLAYRAIATPRWGEAAVFSILANAVSWGAGELIYAVS